MSFRVLRVVVLLVLAGPISGCSFGPWTRMEDHTEGLGKGPIADFFRDESPYFFNSDANLKLRLTELVVDWADWMSVNGRSREYAEALGMWCAPPPKTECIYSGEAWNEVIPPGSLPKGRRVYNIEVRFSYLQPESLVVKVHYRDVAYE